MPSFVPFPPSGHFSPPSPTYTNTNAPHPRPSLSHRTVTASVELRAAAALHFPPSALNFHYYFNVRDMASTFHELCCASGATLPTPMRFVSLWFHESRRVLCDKLASERDATRMLGLVSDVAKKHFEFDVGAIAKTEAYTHGTSGMYLPVESLGEARSTLIEALQVPRCCPCNALCAFVS
jgi:hypothetical protein